MILFLLLLCTITNAKISVKYESKAIKKHFFIESNICFSYKRVFVFLNSKVKAGKNTKVIPIAFEVASIEDKLNWKNTCCGIEIFNKKGSVSFIFNHKSFRVSLNFNISDRISAGVMLDSNNFVKAVEYFKKDSSDSSSSSYSDEVEDSSLSSHDSSSDHEDEHDKSEKKESSGTFKESNNSSDSDEVEGRSLSSHGSSSDHEEVTKNDSVHQKCFIEALPTEVIYEILCYCGAPIMDRDFFRFFGKEEHIFDFDSYEIKADNYTINLYLKYLGELPNSLSVSLFCNSFFEHITVGYEKESYEKLLKLFFFYYYGKHPFVLLNKNKGNILLFRKRLILFFKREGFNYSNYKINKFEYNTLFFKRWSLSSYKKSITIVVNNYRDIISGEEYYKVYEYLLSIPSFFNGHFCFLNHYFELVETDKKSKLESELETSKKEAALKRDRGKKFIYDNETGVLIKHDENGRSTEILANFEDFAINCFKEQYYGKILITDKVETYQVQTNLEFLEIK